jgi:AraC-like DNA-binding protein
VSTAASLILAVKHAAAKEGVSAERLLARAGIDATIGDDRDARVPTLAYFEVLRAGSELTGNPCFGLSVAGAMNGAAFGALAFVMASCATLREALQRFARYTRLLCDELRVDVIEEGDLASIVYVLEGVPAEPTLFEMALCHLVSTARKGTNDAFRPREVVFCHRAAPRSLPAALGAKVAFGGAQNAVICDRAALDLPLRGRNATLLGILERHVEQVLSSMPREEDLVAVVSVAIRALLPLGEPSLADAARRCALGPRTLQRRLHERGVTFRSLIDDVRRDAALEQLAHPHISVAEVAFALGFSDPRAFHHAFRRWTGKSPGDRS